jgi:Tol biopolymer transport system component
MHIEGGMCRLAAGARLLTAACLLGLNAAIAVGQTSAIYVMQVDGSQVRKVADGPGFKSVGHARWSHDGKRLAFQGWDGPTPVRQIFVIAADAKPGTAPDKGPEGQVPDWSPDDKQLAFQTPPAAGTRTSAWAANLDGAGRMLLAPGSSPRWSPDGANLAFIDSEELVIRDLVSEQNSSLMEQPWDGIRLGFDWSANGKRIACVARREGVLGVWIIDTKTRAARLRLEGEVMGQLAWSPDGKQLAITLNNMIQLLNVDDATKPRPIPGQTGASRDPAWSPDGKRIAFSSNR